MQRKLIAVELGKIGIDWALVFTEKAMAPHTSTLAWKTPWAEEPGGLQSMRSLRVRHDWVTSFLLFTFMHWRRKWQPTPVFLPGESQGRGRLVGCRPWGRTDLDTTESDLAAAAAFTKDYQLQGTELSPQEGSPEHESSASHISHLIHVYRISSFNRQNPPFTHAVFSSKNPYLFKSSTLHFYFHPRIPDSFLGKNFFLLYRIGSRSDQKPWLPCTFPSSILLYREIHVWENSSLMRMPRMNTQNPLTAFFRVEVRFFQ